MAKSFEELIQRTTSQATRERAARRAQELFSNALTDGPPVNLHTTCAAIDEIPIGWRRWWRRLNPQLTSHETDRLIGRGIEKASAVHTVLAIGQITFFLWILLPPGKFTLWMAFLTLLVIARIIRARTLPPLRG
jgi:hypothetical protein